MQTSHQQAAAIEAGDLENESDLEAGPFANPDALTWSFMSKLTNCKPANYLPPGLTVIFRNYKKQIVHCYAGLCSPGFSAIRRIINGSLSLSIYIYM